MLKLKTVSFCAALSAGVFLLGPGLATAQPGTFPPGPEPAGTLVPPTFPPGPEPPGILGPPAHASTKAKAKAQPPFLLMKDYKIQPPDLVLVEVLEALPGRPVSGERLVRPDGKISLGFYGEVPVVGLTIPEVKEMIVERMRKYLSDSTLGLVVIDPETGDPKIDPTTKKEIRINPRDTDRVFVDVTAYNSHVYYIQGAVYYPGRLPVTGRETVLDAVIYAGGLCPRADHDHVVLYRPNKDGTLRAMPVDIDQITMGDDPSTNYQLRPGDRLVVPVLPGPQNSTANAASQRGPSEVRRPAIEPASYFDRSRYDSDARKAGHEDRLRELDARLQVIEGKLEEIASGLSSIKELRRLHDRGALPGPLDRPPFEMDEPPTAKPEVPAQDHRNPFDRPPFEMDEPPVAEPEVPALDHQNPFEMDEPPSATDEIPKVPDQDLDAPPPFEAPPAEKPALGTYEDNG